MEKVTENKNQQDQSRAMANNTAQRKETNDATLAFTDNRPEAAMQLRMAEMINNSPQAKQAAQFQAMADNHAAQRQPIQKKPVQRLVYDETGPRLYASNTWHNTQNADGKPVSDALTLDKTKFNDTVKGRIGDGYGIEGYGTTIENDFSGEAETFAEKHLYSKDIQMNLLETAWIQKNPLNTGLKHFMNKMNWADSTKRYNSLRNLGYDFGGFKTGVRAGVAKMVDQDFYLLNWDNARVYSSDPADAFNGLIMKAKPVLLPQDYLEDDSESDINFTLGETETISNPRKTKVCGLISMVYQKAASVTSKPLAKEKISQLLKKFDIDIGTQHINANNIQSGKYLPDNTNLYDTILVELHKVLQPQGTLYDLDRFSEQVLATAGYTRIASCNCNYKDLPANIPPNIILSQGSSYVFHIKGHAQAVVVIKDIQGQLGEANPNTLDSHDNYFRALNETSNNYNHNAWNRAITAIWKE